MNEPGSELVRLKLTILRATERQTHGRTVGVNLSKIQIPDNISEGCIYRNLLCCVPTPSIVSTQYAIYDFTSMSVFDLTR